jgi:hypothetical protein
MNAKTQGKRIDHVARTIGLILGIGALVGSVAPAGADQGRDDRDASGKKAIVLDREAILNRWEPVAQAAGAATPHWREQYAIQLRELPDYLVKQIAATPLAVDDAGTSYRSFTRSFVNAYANLVQNPQPEDKVRLKLGSTTNDQVFFPIAPCRIVDTRNVGGPIAATFARNFLYYTGTGTFSWATQGGAAGNASTACPGTLTTAGGGTLGNVAPSAALATVTVVNATAAGNWLIWGGAGNPAGTSSSALNWGPGAVLANTTLLPWGGRTGTGAGGTVLDFAVKYNGPSGQADVIVDVVGYFVENRATALQCVSLNQTGSGTIPNTDTVRVSLPSCGVGYTKTGSGCYWTTIQTGVYLIEQSLSAFSDCEWRNGSGGNTSGLGYNAEVTCCRVPGQ